MGWTREQEQAITAPSGKGNILVSAAAGSGKTAVLVERIVQKLIAGENIDRLLVVTFTNAAAEEMRDRITERILSEMEGASAENAQHLRRQILLAQTADIMTIDAFCIKVVQNNFHALGISPNVSMADDAMQALLKNTAFDAMVSEMYKSGADRFHRLVEAYASDRNEDGLKEAIVSLSGFISSFAEPDKWLGDAVAVYDRALPDMPYCKYILGISKKAAQRCIDAVEKLEIPDINERDRQAYTAYTDELKCAAQAILDAPDWDAVYEIYENRLKNNDARKQYYKLIHTTPKKYKDKAYAECDETVRFIREAFFDSLKSGVTVPQSDISQRFSRSQQMHEATEDIVWLTREFIKAYEKLKDRRGVHEFNDIERMVYGLFRDNDEIRCRYRDKYSEILIDEYQDTNELQDSIFRLISNDNIFMVGDLKQSIYRFRNGDPYIFKAKSDLYAKKDNAHTKITLAQNFRSRQEVLCSVNDLFSRIMSDEAGDVDYSGDELIVRDRDREYYPPTGGCKAELHYIAVCENADTKEREASFIAEKIAALLESGVRVYDKKSKEMRRIQKRDIVILANSVKTVGPMLTEELTSRGIDAYCDRSSFFDRREIQVMLSLISVINNSLQDIPMLAVMRSPIGDFTDNELARIRLTAGKTENITEACRICAESEDGELPVKCRRFLSDLARWRGYIRNKSVAQLIWTIYEETYFYDIMGAIEEGEEAQFNLRLLYERAKQYEKAGLKGLFGFINYIKIAEKHSSETNGARTIGEGSDVVRIMTVHKSKGLEFPYVFLADAGRGFPPNRGTAAFRMHKELMLGVCDIHYDMQYRQKTALYNLIDEVNKKELTSERMRLLYVALTRAEEKLFVVATREHSADDDAERIKSEYKKNIKYGRMKPKKALSARGFYDWIAPVAFSCPDFWDYELHIGYEPERTDSADDAVPTEYSPELMQSVDKILDYQYGYEKSSIVPSRTSVTQLKELSIERGNIDEPIYEPDSRRVAEDIAELMFSPLHRKPAFMRQTGEKAANEIGTLYHAVLANTDIDRVRRDADCIESELTRLVGAEIISESDLKYIDAGKIKSFYTSELGKRMLASDEIRRETPFQINISARVYDPSLDEKYDGESVILQGIIDCFFREGDGYVLIDYKTDKVKGNSTAIRRKYEKQLELYTQAIERLTGRRVKEQYLFLLDNGEVM